MVQWVSPVWRAWFKQTRLPGLRQLVSLIRFGLHLKRLGQMPNTEEMIHMHAAIGQWPHQRLALEQRIAEQETRLHTLTALQNHYRDQIDLLKSAGEVPAEWFEELSCWKRENPLPEMPLVSICVATWNRARLLTQRSLPSLLRQTYKNLEIVVVGDGCTDDTKQRIADLGDSRIRFVNLPQRGRYPDEPKRRWMVAGTVPMNHALTLCTGDFITHLDDDDEHDPSRVEKLLAFVRANNLDFVWHPFHHETVPGHRDFFPCEELRIGHVTTSSIFYRRWLARIGWDINAHMLAEPGDWNRLRKFLYLGIKAQRFPESLLRHHNEHTPKAAAA